MSLSSVLPAAATATVKFGVDFGLGSIPCRPALAQRPLRLRFEAMDKQAAERRSVLRGEALFRQGDALLALFEVQAGMFKATLCDDQGRLQVTGFPMTGDLLGLDAIGSDQHVADAVALEDALVSVIPFEALNRRCREAPELQHEFHCVMSREIRRDQAMMLWLGTLNAEGRIASFLLDLTKRLQERGYSGRSLVLRMSREEIGSHLGLQLETVSRTFSKLQAAGVLRVHHRELQVIDLAALAAAAGGAAA